MLLHTLYRIGAILHDNWHIYPRRHQPVHLLGHPAQRLATVIRDMARSTQAEAHEASYLDNTRRGFSSTDVYPLNLPKLLGVVTPGLQEAHVYNYLFVIKTGPVWAANRKRLALSQTHCCAHCRAENAGKHNLGHECRVFEAERAPLPIRHFQSTRCHEELPESLALFATPPGLSSNFICSFWHKCTIDGDQRTAVGNIPVRWQDNRKYRNANTLFAAPGPHTAAEAFRAANGDDRWPRYPNLVPPPIDTPIYGEDPPAPEEPAASEADAFSDASVAPPRLLEFAVGGTTLWLLTEHERAGIDYQELFAFAAITENDEA